MEKTKELKKLISEINDTNNEKHKVITTGIKSLDFLLGGGMELGSKVQFVAEPSTGKTTIALQISKNFCKKDLNVLYVDTENSVTNELLKATGCDAFVNNDNNYNGELVLLKESDFNSVSDKLDKCFKSKYFQLVIIDSLASMVSNCYVDLNESVKSLTNNNTNFESRPINLFINKYSNLANTYNVAILYINQYRNKVDPKHGTILKEFGAKVVRYNSDIIIKIKKLTKGELWQDENGIFSCDSKVNGTVPPTHSCLSFTLDKSNKMLSGTSIDTYIRFGYGIDDLLDDTLNKIKNSEINKEGKYYSLPNDTQKYDGFINLVNNIVEKSKSLESVKEVEYVSEFWDED